MSRPRATYDNALHFLPQKIMRYLLTANGERITHCFFVKNGQRRIKERPGALPLKRPWGRILCNGEDPHLPRPQ